MLKALPLLTEDLRVYFLCLLKLRYLWNVLNVYAQTEQVPITYAQLLQEDAAAFIKQLVGETVWQCFYGQMEISDTHYVPKELFPVMEFALQKIGEKYQEDVQTQEKAKEILTRKATERSREGRTPY